MTINPAATVALFEAIRTGNDLAVDAAVAVNEELLRAHDEAGLSPVVAAASAGHIRLAERLAARLAKSADGIGFFDAAAIGNVPAVRNLLSVDLAAVDDRGPDGCTALHLAARFGQMEVARLLLGLGADPNAISLNDERVPSTAPWWPIIATRPRSCWLSGRRRTRLSTAAGQRFTRPLAMETRRLSPCCNCAAPTQPEPATTGAPRSIWRRRTATGHWPRFSEWPRPSAEPLQYRRK